MSGSGPWGMRVGTLVPRLLDPVLAVALAGVALATAWAVPSALGTMPLPLAVALGLVAAGAIGLRRRWPVGVLAVVAGCVLIEQAFGASLNFGSLALLIAIFTVASERPRRTSLVCLALLPGYLLVLDLLFGTVHPGSAAAEPANFLSALAVFGLAWFFGDSIRGRRLRTSELEARAERLEREQAEAARIAVQNARALIARELHDVVAHGVSVMVVQAGAARRIMDEQPEEARTALASIEATGREALIEMRRLLGVLRSDDAPAPFEPQRGLAGLGGVISSANRSGVTVELAIEGEPRPLPPGLDLTAFRIVQEALTNTIKHAAPAHATVRLRYEPDAIGLEIVDDGARPKDGPGARPGHGLVGMEERVRLFGGEFQAGPRAPSGFRIQARLPIGVASS